MRSDPEPDYTVKDRDSQSAVMEADANRPKLSDLLEMQGRMAGVLFQ
jgi:hypothetical protein